MSELTIFSDNVIPCVLNALGILEYDDALAEYLKKGQVLPAGDWECQLRAGAIVAGDQIVAKADKRLGLLDLDTYLWRVGKSVELGVWSLEFGVFRNSPLAIANVWLCRIFQKL
jgi:hypothetical protein